jgi:hypothetical protein
MPFFRTILIATGLTLLSSLSPVSAQTSVVCSDTDKGKNLAVQGELVLKFYQNQTLVKEQSYQDFFSGSRNRYLEFYCNGTKPAYEIIACPNEELGKSCPVIERLAAEPKIQVKMGETIFPGIIIQNSRDVPVLNFNLTAYDGDVDLKGLHFVLEDPGTASAEVTTLNEIKTAELYNFELYDSTGDIVAQTRSEAGRIYFDLDQENYLLSGSQDFTVKVDLPAIEAVEQSWRWFRISLDKSYEGHGVQGVSTDTGNFVEGVMLGQIGAWPSSELFVNATTKISVTHAAIQPPIVEPSIGGQEFYRFAVEADRMGTAEIEQLTFEVLLEGMEFTGEVEGRVFLVQDDGSIDFSNVVADSVTVIRPNESNMSAQIKIEFENQLVLPGQKNTYTLFLNRTRPLNLPEDISYAFSILTDSQKSTTREARLLKTASNIVWSDLPSFENENRFMRGFLTMIESTAKVFIGQ